MGVCWSDLESALDLVRPSPSTLPTLFLGGARARSIVEDKKRVFMAAKGPAGARRRSGLHRKDFMNIEIKCSTGMMVKGGALKRHDPDRPRKRERGYLKLRLRLR